MLGTDSYTYCNPPDVVYWMLCILLKRTPQGIANSSTANIPFVRTPSLSPSGMATAEKPISPINDANGANGI